MRYRTLPDGAWLSAHWDETRRPAVDSTCVCLGCLLAFDDGHDDRWASVEEVS